MTQEKKKGQAIQMFKIGLHEGIYFLCQTCGEAELQKPQHIGLNLLIAYFYNKDQRKSRKSIMKCSISLSFLCLSSDSSCRFSDLMDSISQVGNIARCHTRHTDSAIARHVDMELICQAINLLRGHPAVAKHANLISYMFPR